MLFCKYVTIITHISYAYLRFLFKTHSFYVNILQDKTIYFSWLKNECSKFYLLYIKFHLYLLKHSDDARKLSITPLKLSNLKQDKNTITTFIVASPYRVTSLFGIETDDTS